MNIKVFKDSSEYLKDSPVFGEVYIIHSPHKSDKFRYLVEKSGVGSIAGFTLLEEALAYCNFLMDLK